MNVSIFWEGVMHYSELILEYPQYFVEYTYNSAKTVFYHSAKDVILSHPYIYGAQ